MGILIPAPIFIISILVIYNPSAWIYPPLGTLARHKYTGKRDGDLRWFSDRGTSNFKFQIKAVRELEPDVSTWEAFNGTIWIPATGTPSSSAGYVMIRSPHVVTNSSPVTVDQAIIDPGGLLNY